MHSEQLFPPLDRDTAGHDVRPVLIASENKFGFLPSPVAKLAHAPGVLKHLLAGFGVLEQTSLSAPEREVIAMTVAYEHDCHYCMAMHSALLARNDADALVEPLRAGATLAEPRLATLQHVVRDFLRGRELDESRWAELRGVGFSERQVLEVLLGTAVYWLSTRANGLTRAELDPPFVPFAWRRGEPGAAR